MNLDEKEVKTAFEIAGSEIFTLNKYLENQDMVMHHDRFKRMIKSLNTLTDLAEQYLRVGGIINIEQLKKEYATQDNRATAYPIYVTVQELTCIGVMANGFSPIGDDSEIIMEHSCDGCNHDCTEEQQNSEHCDEDVSMGYLWLDVEFFLTIKGAEEYMKANAHNHDKLRTYVKHFERRNFEMRRLLKEMGFKSEK